MSSKREMKPATPFLLNDKDHRGRPIASPLLSVAQEIAPRAVNHGEKLLGDPALALSLFKEAAATVSNTIVAKQASGKPGIRDLRNYLFRVYLRRIDTERKASLTFEDATERDWEKHAQRLDKIEVERDILFKEVLKSCDTLTREIFYLKLEGCSWKEIEKRCGIPVNAASLRFSKALRQLQTLVRTRGR
jgi:DNA-directed RNA polymerase specialized sigma24 family protein